MYLASRYSYLDPLWLKNECAKETLAKFGFDQTAKRGRRTRMSVTGISGEEDTVVLSEGLGKTLSDMVAMKEQKG